LTAVEIFRKLGSVFNRHLLNPVQKFIRNRP